MPSFFCSIGWWAPLSSVAGQSVLVANHVADPDLKKFYAAIAKSEKRHWHLFAQLAKLCNHLPVDSRFCELAVLENALVEELPQGGPSLISCQ